MIIKFKIFESLNDNSPQVGDYVICHEGTMLQEYELCDFLKSNIGQIINISGFLNANYRVKYKKRPAGSPAFYFYTFENIRNIRNFDISEIKHWSKNKEDLEPIAQFNRDLNKFRL